MERRSFIASIVAILASPFLDKEVLHAANKPETQIYERYPPGSLDGSVICFFHPCDPSHTYPIEQYEGHGYRLTSREIKSASWLKRDQLLIIVDGNCDHVSLDQIVLFEDETLWVILSVDNENSAITLKSTIGINNGQI